MTDSKIPLRCACGDVAGTARDVSPSRGNRLVCMCDDCQAYAHWLGRAEQILDAHGGTEVFQLTPAQLDIVEGAEHMRCMRLSSKGLMRWYAACCKTPLMNTLHWPRMPFASVIHSFIAPDVDRNETLGPVLARVNGRFGKAPLPADAHLRAPLGIIVRSVRQLLGAWIRGAHTPSPFFDPRTGAPVVEPTVLDAAERARLRPLCGPS